MTMHDVFERYRRNILPLLGKRTQKDYARTLVTLDEHFGSKLPDDVKPRDIGMFLDVKTGKIHRNRQVAVLSAVFTKAVGRWYLADRNPCLHVERNDQHRRSRYVTDEEYKIVYDAMPAKLQIAMDLALLTGQRQGDLLELRWKDVSEDGVYFQQNKTGKKLLVGLSEALSAVLERARRLNPAEPKEYVIRRGDGLRYTPEGFRAPWQRRTRRLVTGYWRKKKGQLKVWIEPRLKERYTFHDLRAKCVSDTKDINSAFERAGHTNIALTRGIYDRGVRKVTPLR
jgi:integrase